MQLEKAAETTFVWKIRTINVDEIDTRTGPVYTNKVDKPVQKMDK